MEVEEESEGEDESEDEWEAETKLQNKQELQVLSLQAMAGLTTKRTMRIKGHIKGEEVVVLIDLGASCNFIATWVVEKLGLPVVPPQEIGVAIGDGRVMTSSGNFVGLKLDIQGIEIHEEYMLFDLGATDMVLGYTWLATLGVVYLLELQTLFENSKEQEQAVTPSSEVKRLLQKLKVVFNMHIGLPPKRSRENAITLQAGTSPINIRPYCGNRNSHCRFPYK